METIILGYLLIGWLLSGLGLTIYYSFRSDWIETALSIIQAILYWPWILIAIVYKSIREQSESIKK